MKFSTCRPSIGNGQLLRAAGALAFAAVLALPVGAQVHRCVDAAGKFTFSDTACPTSAKSAGQVMGAGATERNPETEALAAQRNMASIQRSRAALAGSVDVVTRQSQAPEDGGGPAVLDAPPNQQTRSVLTGPASGDECQTTSTRKGCIGGSRQANPNWSPNRGYYGGGGPADQKYEREQEQARQAAAARAARPPEMLTNCNAGGCWDSQGNRFNRTGDGSRLVGTDGRTCRDDGARIVCR